MKGGPKKKPSLCAGRFEFLEYLPSNTQGVAVKPLGRDGVLVVAADTQRAFGNIDQVSASERTCKGCHALKDCLSSLVEYDSTNNFRFPGPSYAYRRGRQTLSHTWLCPLCPTCPTGLAGTHSRQAGEHSGRVRALRYRLQERHRQQCSTKLTVS